MPLKVIIVGAGIVGLATAISLRRANHQVIIFEQSAFADEIGAAINIAPNASRILKDWGMDLNSFHGVPCDHLSVWSSQMDLIRTPVVTSDLSRRFGFEANWQLVHRADLHTQLKEFCMDPRIGPVPELHLSSKVVSIDAANGEVQLHDGTIHKADLIVGADGIHSRVAEYVSGQEIHAQSTGQSCFRFLVPTSKLRSNPVTSKLQEKCGFKSVDAFATADCRLVLYPCRNNELLNVVAIHPAQRTGEAAQSDWLGYGSKSDLEKIYKDFSPELREMCRMAEDLKLYGLSTREPIRTFVNGKGVLVGDAAHPMLPHQGQGAAQGIEDAATLGTLLPSSTSPSSISDILTVYNKLRFARGTTVMLMSKTHDENRGAMMKELLKYVPDAELPPNMFEYTWKWDATDMARRALLARANSQIIKDVEVDSSAVEDARELITA